MPNDERNTMIEEGLIAKSAEIKVQEVTDDDLKKINKFTLSPLKAEDVFTFKTVIGDNETDDRNYEPFNARALKDLRKLYIGRTMIKDHLRRADNQIGRVYDTELVTSDNKVTGAGEVYTQLIAKNYMVRTAANEDLIKEIQGGIKKEVSTGVRPGKLICNICGADNMKTYCPHWPGRDYTKDTGETETCLMTIDGAKEAYELSLVAVPAQPRAGTIKHYGPKPPEEPDEEKAENDDLNAEIAENRQKTGFESENEAVKTDQDSETDNKDSEINLRVKALESFCFVESNQVYKRKGK